MKMEVRFRPLPETRVLTAQLVGMIGGLADPSADTRPSSITPPISLLPPGEIDHVVANAISLLEPLTPSPQEYPPLCTPRWPQEATPHAGSTVLESRILSYECTALDLFHVDRLSPRNFAMIPSSNNGDNLISLPTSDAQTMGMTPTGADCTRPIRDDYNQLVPFRFHTPRKRISSVVQDATGPHGLGPWARGYEESPLEEKYDSDPDVGTISGLLDEDYGSLACSPCDPYTVYRSTAVVCAFQSDSVAFI